jgi:hypothetical protein
MKTSAPKGTTIHPANFARRHKIPSCVSAIAPIFGAALGQYINGVHQ